MNTATQTNVQALRAACDQLVATAADPTTARSVLLRMWALGAAAADDLVADLHQLAVHHATRTGTEAPLTELLHALGHHKEAANHSLAVSAALAEHDDHNDHAVGDVDHDDDPEVHQGWVSTGAAGPQAIQAARAAVRIHQTVHNRHRAPLRVA